MEIEAIRNLMQPNKEKCRVIHLGRNSLRYQEGMGVYQLESSSIEKELGVLVNTILNVTQQCALW